jgi:gluconolactonase
MTLSGKSFPGMWFLCGCISVFFLEGALSQDVIYSPDKNKTEERWRRFDKNGDGRLDEAEQKAYRKELLKPALGTPAPTLLPIFMDPIEKTVPVKGLGPIREISRLQSGFSFTEGPAADRHGNLFFSDFRRNRIYRYQAGETAEVFLENSQGIYGLAFDGKGRLIACQCQEGRIVSIHPSSKKVRILADLYQGNRFNDPNDVVVDRKGGVYFTDPSFRQKHQAKEGVYYISPDRKVTRIIDDLEKPNGIALSPQEDMLYVLPSGAASVMAYPVKRPGVIGPGVRLGSIPSVGDGMTVDALGNLYVTQPRLNAIFILNPRGESLGRLKVPEPPSNCEFGGPDGGTLFVTAHTSLYCFKMEVSGSSFRTSH